MTGGPVSFRRWSGCNLHWHTPRRYQHRLWSGKSPHCCGWDWLASLTSPRRIRYIFYSLCDHVHTPHRERFNANLAAQRLFVRVTRSRDLDERLHTDVFPNAHLYRICVRVDEPSAKQVMAAWQFLAGHRYNTKPMPWRANRVQFEWDEAGSNSFTALRSAQSRLEEAWGTIGGTSWENPVRIAKEKS